MILDSLGKKKIYSSIAILFGLLFVFTALLLPKAEIVISLKNRQFKKTYSVILDKTIPWPLAPINRIPYSSFRETDVWNEGDIPLPEMNALVEGEHVRAFINEKVEDEIDKNTEQFDENSLRYTLAITDAKHAIATLYVESVILPKIDMDEIKRSIRGKKIKEARDYLARLSFSELESFTVYPAFLPFVPFISERIEITAL